MVGTTKDRTKTHVGREIETALTSLNDQHAYFLFLEFQFLEQIRGLTITSATKVTTEAFPRNRYAPTIRVRIRDLQAFGEAHRSATFGAYFATSYEIAASFTGRALDSLQHFNQRSLPPRARRPEGPEETYRRVLNLWGLAMPARELIDTLKFMRYRRNSLIHLSKVPSPSYQDLASQSGSVLNAFWTRGKVEIDFRIPATTPLAEREALDLLKLLRIVIQRLDTHFASIIDERGLVQAEARRLFGGNKRRINIEQRTSLLRTQILHDYGLSPRESYLRAAARSVGTA
jgi:hypothetical protein